MKKIYFFLAVSLLALSTSASAQLKPFSIGLYGEVGMPTGDFGKGFNTGFGGGLTADFNLPVGFGITGSAGYMHFPGKISGTKLSAIPIRAGIKYKVAMVYFKVEGGVASISNGGGSPFIVSPGIGVKLLKFDVQAKYEVWAQNNSLAFWGGRVAFHF